MTGDNPGHRDLGSQAACVLCGLDAVCDGALRLGYVHHFLPAPECHWAAEVPREEVWQRAEGDLAHEGSRAGVALLSSRVPEPDGPPSRGLRAGLAAEPPGGDTSQQSNIHLVTPSLPPPPPAPPGVATQAPGRESRGTQWSVRGPYGHEEDTRLPAGGACLRARWPGPAGRAAGSPGGACARSRCCPPG